jgi:hypothetical protein
MRGRLALGRAAPTRTVRDDGRHCPMHVDAAPEARTLIANWLAEG